MVFQNRIIIIEIALVKIIRSFIDQNYSQTHTRLIRYSIENNNNNNKENAVESPKSFTKHLS